MCFLIRKLDGGTACPNEALLPVIRIAGIKHVYMLRSGDGGKWCGNTRPVLWWGVMDGKVTSDISQGKHGHVIYHLLLTFPRYKKVWYFHFKGGSHAHWVMHVGGQGSAPVFARVPQTNNKRSHYSFTSLKKEWYRILLHPPLASHKASFFRLTDAGHMRLFPRFPYVEQSHASRGQIDCHPVWHRTLLAIGL